MSGTTTTGSTTTTTGSSSTGSTTTTDQTSFTLVAGPNFTIETETGSNILTPISSITITTTTVSSDQTASSTATISDGVLIINLSVPQGIQGDSPTIIPGTISKGNALNVALPKNADGTYTLNLEIPDVESYADTASAAATSATASQTAAATSESNAAASATAAAASEKAAAISATNAAASETATSGSATTATAAATSATASQNAAKTSETNAAASAQTAQTAATAAAASSAASSVVRILGYSAATPTASEVLTVFVADTTLTIPSNFGTSHAAALTAPAADFAISVDVNKASIGTITLKTDGTLSMTGTQTTLSAGDIVSITAPATADTAIANLALTLVLSTSAS